MHKPVLIAFLISLFASQVMAKGDTPDIKVLGLFRNMAVLKINDQRTVMHVGDKVDGNVCLLAADSKRALLEIQGHRVELSLSDNNSVSTDYPDTGNIHQAQLISNGGLYAVTGAINGQLANFVLDTGASYVTMSTHLARMLHIDFQGGRKLLMNTANGRAVAHVFTLDSVRIGDIELRNVQAAAMDNLSSSRILLGLSFLNRVDMKRGNGFMVLKQRF